MSANTDSSSSSLPPFLIKICGITREADARAAIDAGANALGFNFYPASPRYLSAARAGKFIAAVPGTYTKVGVFVNPSLQDLLSTLRVVPLDVVQLHGDRSSAVSASLPNPIRVWRAITVEARQDDPANIEAFLLDSPSPTFGGSGRPFDWSSARPFTHALSRPFLLAGGLAGDNVAASITALKPRGVDACSRLESSPGCKDAARVRTFVAAALTAFRQILQESLL